MRVVLKFGYSVLTYKIIKTLLSGFHEVSKYFQTIWPYTKMKLKTTIACICLPGQHLLPLPPNSHFSQKNNILQNVPVSSIISVLQLILHLTHALAHYNEVQNTFKMYTSHKSQVAQPSVHFYIIQLEKHHVYHIYCRKVIFYISIGRQVFGIE